MKQILLLAEKISTPHRAMLNYDAYLRNLEGRRKRMAQIFACILFWKRLSMMFHLSYQNVEDILSIEKPLEGRR